MQTFNVTRLAISSYATIFLLCELPSSSFDTVRDTQTLDWYWLPSTKRLISKLPNMSNYSFSRHMRFVQFISIILLLNYMVNGQKRGENMKKSSESLTSVHFLLCLEVKSTKRSGSGVDFSPCPWQSLWASKALCRVEMFHSFGFTLKSIRYLLESPFRQR